MSEPRRVTIQGGWLDGRIITIPAGHHDLVVMEEPRIGPAEWFTNAEAAELLSRQLRLPLEHIAENEYLARWPVREDPRYCPTCACPPESAGRTVIDAWQCVCRFGHAWILYRRNLTHYPSSAWPAALQRDRSPGGR